MAAKPELTAASGLQNVLVYVSNDNFAQAYAVEQQNVSANSDSPVQNGTYTNPPHSMATVVAPPPKPYHDKMTNLKPPEYQNNQLLNGAIPHQQSYYAEVIPQNGFSQQQMLNNIDFQNNPVVNQVKAYAGGNNEVLSGERQAGPGRPPPEPRDCNGERDGFADSGYVAVMGAECAPQSVRCDSVRSETAESSCSSLSSADEGVVVVQNPQNPADMVVYDSGASVRPGGVVLAVASSPQVLPPPQQQAAAAASVRNGPNQQQYVTVPYGWKRLTNNGVVVYISPSNTPLTSSEQAKEYLLSSGTCKCGLECHFKYDSIFNFDPKVAGKPWGLIPDTNTGDLTKLCNHKRKLMAMASLDYKPPDSKLRKDYIKRKKRKTGMGFVNNVSISQLLAQRDKVTMNNQNFNKDEFTSNNSQQIWQQQSVENISLPTNRLQTYPDNASGPQLVRYPNQDQNNSRMPMGLSMHPEHNMMLNQQHQQVANISHQMQHQPQQQPQQMQNSTSNNSVQIHQHHMISQNGQIINLHKSNQMQNNQNSVNNHMVSSTNSSNAINNMNQSQPQRQRMYVNGPQVEASGPGRPNVQMVPVNIENQNRQLEVQQRMSQPPVSTFYGNQGEYHSVNQFDPNKPSRPFVPPPNQNGYRHHLQNQMSHGAVPQTPGMHHQRPQWQLRAPPPQNNNVPNQMIMSMQQNPQSIPSANIYERVPPLHEHTQHPTNPAIWNEELKKKKAKMNKLMKNRAYNLMENQANHGPCPNIDVRQIPNDSTRTIIINQLPQSNQTSASPSFLEDPSGYLAQQTALLNNTINRQTGANPCSGFICNTTPSSVEDTTVQNTNTISIPCSQVNEIHLPSNVTMTHMRPVQSLNRATHQNINIIKEQQLSNNSLHPHLYNQQIPQGMPDSSIFNEHNQCQGCIADSMNLNTYKDQAHHKLLTSRPNSQPGTPSSSVNHEDPVTSSTFIERISNQGSPDNRPIQGGTVSTSNVSPADGMLSGPSTPNPHTPNPHTPNPHTPSSHTPNPHTPSSHTPNSHTPNPHTPNSHTPNPHTPNSHTPNPLTPNSHMSNPQTPNPHFSNPQSSNSNFSNSQTPTSHTPSPQMLNPHIPNSHGNNISSSQMMGIHMSNQHSQMQNSQLQNSGHISGQINNSNLPNGQVLLSNSQQYGPNVSVSLQRSIANSPATNNFVVYSSSDNSQQLEQIHHIKDGSNLGYQAISVSRPEFLVQNIATSRGQFVSNVVTTMASGRTVGSNTITSVLAGRANTATVSVNAPQNVANPSSTNSGTASTQLQPIAVNVSKSPLEMVQSVVSSIQVPHTQQPQVIKHSPTNLPPGHILVSSGGQLIMASTSNCQSTVMPPPPPKLVANPAPMPPITVSPVVTNVTAAVTQMIPAVAQQVLGQQTVLVNALQTPFVLQPGVTMTMDGVTVGQNMQIPQLVTGNVIQQQIQIDNSDSRRTPALLSPDNKKKGKKRKIPSQTVANMLQLTAQQNPNSVVMSQQGFSQQIQMAHSPQNLTASPVMQALTIVPSKNGGPPQIVMNGNTNLGTQQIITNSQPTQQINLLQPVNLINGTAGVVQNFPTIQQFIVPNLGGMVMNADGTATILQDTSNLGMQLQLQNVNGQNVLTQVQNGSVFNANQSILAAGPAGMVIRGSTAASQSKIIQQQQHSPTAQFLSPNGGQFVVNGTQLSPLVANVSPSQQVTFGTPTQQIRPSNQSSQQEFIQCNQMGQAVMVPCSLSTNISASSSNQNTTFVQQNTTIVQQQTTMVSNNQNFQQNNTQQNQQSLARTTTLNVDQNFIISANDNKQLQAVLVRDNSQNANGYRQSVSTQTAVCQNSHSVTTNTFCQTLSAGSPPDTTTHSPLAMGGQSPPTADTTTHSGSTDDGLSPISSNGSLSFNDINIQNRNHSCTMAMVHCVSSSEPDSADINNTNLDNENLKNHSIHFSQKYDMTDVTSAHMIQYNKKAPAHIAYVESSTSGGLHFISDQLKPQESIISSRNFDKILPKRKSIEASMVIDTRHMHFEESEDSHAISSLTPTIFKVGDVIWGANKGYIAWPGKIVDLFEDEAKIKWYGNDKSVTMLKTHLLRTLTEGLDVHHQAQKRIRTSRKLNSQLEKAIQEAMADLDQFSLKLNDSIKTAAQQSLKKPLSKLKISPK